VSGDSSGSGSANATLVDDERSVEGARVLAQVMSGLFGSDAAEPVRIGRFVVLRRLGAGAMGEVYAAYDGELDRKVAIKLLRARPDAERLQVRLRREAQAIAKLAHPNVVPVFEVGDDGGRLFLVMEMIEGTTLRAWLREGERARDEILDMFEQAGRGLVAAHSANLVHRDLKPDNILVGHDGRVRLVDFGLARAEPGERTPSGASDPSATHDSTVAGTPRYMAPEQFLGARVDHRADQFAFCVSLYEGLYGTPPFDGRSVTEVASKVLAGDIDAPPRDHAVPSAIARLLRRGLAREPEQRFFDMQALLHELQRARGAPRRRALAGALGLVAAGGLALFVVERRASAACEAEGEHGHDGWNAQRADEIAAAMRSTSVPFAEHAIARIVESLDARTREWAEARTASCLARRRNPDDDTLARTDACLDERLLERDAMLRVLDDADRSVAATSEQAVATLPAVADCTDLRKLGQSPPLPSPGMRESIGAVRPTMARIGALEAAGRYAEAQSIARELLPELERLDYPPLRAELLWRLGELADELGQLPASESFLRQAYFLAGRHGLDRIAAEAALALVTIVGRHAHRVEDGGAWIEHAEMMVARLDDAELRAGLAYAVGGHELAQGHFADGIARIAEGLEVHRGIYGDRHPALLPDMISLGVAYELAGDFSESRSQLLAARALAEEVLGAGHPLVAAAVHNLANLAHREGNYAEAAALHREALAIREAAYGAEHVETVTSISGIGSALGAAGDLEGAEAQFRRSLAMAERVLGPEHPRIMSDLENLGIVLTMERRFDEAQVLFERACRIVEQEKVETPRHAMCLENLADVLYERHRYEESIATYRRALEIRERTVGPDHTSTVTVALNLAMVYSNSGRAAEAVPIYERATAQVAAALGDDHPVVQEARLGLGRARLRSGDAAGAVAPIELVLEKLADDPAASSLRGQAELALAQARWQLGEHARALELGRTAETRLAALGSAASGYHDDAVAWLASHAD
jgi:tetratricopeptide (TPR) repeat protein/predicted Ser/Thr protein kinase